MQGEEALTYNDANILENMNCAKLFNILKNDKFNLFKNLSKRDYQAYRYFIIRLILNTDTQKHFTIMKKFKGIMVSSSDSDIKQTIDSNIEYKILILSVALKCADIGWSVKQLELH